MFSLHKSFFRYISIVREEGLEISQPALDARKSEVHHHITVRRGRSKVHRLVSFFMAHFVELQVNLIEAEELLHSSSVLMLVKQAHGPMYLTLF